MNIWTDTWDADDDWSGGGAKSRRLVPRGPFLGATVYELDPGKWVVYHAHHGSEELLLVLCGTPTLRTPEGAHGFRNDTDEPVRYVVAGTRVSPEVVEYPDLKQVTAQSRHGLFLIHDVEEEA